jgi:hypothetical protein
MSCNDKKCRCCTTVRGERGLRGNDGDIGPVGPRGEQGIPGGNGQDGAKGDDGADGIDGIIPDSGWVDLLGFDFYPGSIEKPKARRIGNMIHFKGFATIPLSSDTGNTLVPFISGTEYYNKPFVQPWIGVGGVSLNAAGSLTFNNGNQVVPDAVLTVGTPLDDNYRKDWVIGTRPVVFGEPANHGTSMVGTYNLIMTNDRKLVLATLKDLEETSVIQPYISSPLRYVNTFARVGEYVPDARNINSNLHSLKTGPSATNSVDLQSSTNTWQFNCDAAQQDEIGGFTVNLDGLMAYIPE